ncbi:hypothetical protein [Halorussus caseinilyticus]|uniref:DUF916 domain-containing protein n=1 Tax=Halorussus caseinilyticus TaxID=3034025 RepID=A0ABD5WMR8_9EURY|nr:hypothetical protein [Halorussus sp. DT72]
MSRENTYAVWGVLALLAVVAVPQVGVVTADLSNDDGTNGNVTSVGGIEYRVSLGTNDSTMLVEYTNPTDREIESAGYVVTVDGQRVYEENVNLSEGEYRTERVNITPGIDVNRDDHTVTFSTFGGHTHRNFTRSVDSAESGRIPTPYVSDVEVREGTIDGEPSAVAEVTLVNPSRQLYGTKLMVHTTGTDGSLYPASVRPGDSRTITVELLDDRGAKIAGEARLYTGNMTTKEGAIDQVGFAGRDGAKTRTWNTSYEPVRPTWMSDHYEYRNDSYTRSFGEKISGGHELGGIPLAYLGIGLLVGWMVVRKFR